MDEFNFVFVAVIALCIVIVAAPVACTMRQNELIADAIKSGVDPINARCAIIGKTNENAEICMAIALKQATK